MLRFAWTVPLVAGTFVALAAGEDDEPGGGDDKPVVVDLWPGKVPDGAGTSAGKVALMSPKLDRTQVEVTEPTRMVTNVTKPTHHRLSAGEG